MLLLLLGHLLSSFMSRLDVRCYIRSQFLIWKKNRKLNSRPNIFLMVNSGQWSDGTVLTDSISVADMSNSSCSWHDRPCYQRTDCNIASWIIDLTDWLCGEITVWLCYSQTQVTWSTGLHWGRTATTSLHQLVFPPPPPPPPSPPPRSSTRHHHTNTQHFSNTNSSYINKLY